jgi:hypothetical protein
MTTTNTYLENLKTPLQFRINNDRDSRQKFKMTRNARLLRNRRPKIYKIHENDSLKIGKTQPPIIQKEEPPIIQKEGPPITQNEELSITQNEEPRQFSPLSVLRKMHPYPISCLAMLDEGALSGSQSLEVICPGYGSTPNSDFDIYQLADPYAMIDVMHTLRFAPVRWNNFVTTYLTQVKKFGLAVVPYPLFVELADKMQTPSSVLRAYLRSRYDDPTYFAFCDRFTTAYETCQHEWSLSRLRIFTKHGLREDPVPKFRFKAEAENKVWVFRAGSGQVKDVPDSVKTLLQNDEIATLRDGLKKAVTDWEKIGLQKELLAGYIKSRLISSRTNVGNVALRMNRIFGRPDATDELENVYHGRTTDMEGKEKEFHILRGTLPTNIKIQLMLVPAENNSVLHTVLGFYATHPMSLVNGAYGTHLYYNLAKDHISHEVDVSHFQWKHDKAPLAKEKYEKRKWTFKPLHKGRKLRSGASDSVAMADYEYIYKSAMHKVQALPSWWDDYFRSRREALETSSWLENKGKITNTTYHHEFISRRGNLLQWVQESLSGHDDVIPKHLWEKREDIGWTRLDLWFGGAKALALQMSCIR